MRRRLLNLLTALSLLLCVGVCVLWVRSYYTADVIMRTVYHKDPLGWSRVQLESNRGALDLHVGKHWTNLVADETPRVEWEYARDVVYEDPPPYWWLGGFHLF